MSGVIEFTDRPELGAGALRWPVFDLIGRTLKRGKTILELGSGVGTSVLTRHWKVFSVEHDERCLRRDPLATYIEAPLVDGWYDPDVLEMCIPNAYDLLIIDGPTGNREGILEHLDLFDMTVPVILDDVDHRGALSVVRAVASRKERIAPSLRPSGPGRRCAFLS